MFGKKACVILGVPPIESLSVVHIAHFIDCKNYEERVTTIHTCKSYNEFISDEKESNHQQVRKNKTIKRILVVDDEHDSNLAKLVLEENGFKVDSFIDPYEALETSRDAQGIEPDAGDEEAS